MTMVPAGTGPHSCFLSKTAGPARSGPRRDRGLTLGEVLTVLALLAVVFLLAISALPRRREAARMASCRQNLMRIGTGLALYESWEGALPVVPPLGRDPVVNGGPIRRLLEALGQPDLSGLSDASKRPRTRNQDPPTERPLAGFVCPSDRGPTVPPGFPAPVSYRATTGENPEGTNGGFAPGRPLTFSEVEAGDGRGFTAAFSERPLGTGRPGEPSAANYFVTSGPVSAPGCPQPGPGGWKGDAGSSWAEAAWRSTLYNHATPPGAGRSCVADDGVSALFGASSSHAAGVNVLTLDGGVRTVRPTIDPQVWKGLATWQGTPPARDPGAGREPAGRSTP